MNVAESRSEILRGFLEQHGLAGWFSWRPDELVMQLGHVPYWGLSFLLLLRDSPNILFVPEIEPHDTAPAGTDVIAYPWGSLACEDPFDVLRKRLEDELIARHLAPESIGRLRDSYRSSLPILAAEQPPLPPEKLNRLTSGMLGNASFDAAFLALYLHKTATEIERIRLANKIAQRGIEAWRNALCPGATEAETAAVAEASIQSLTGKDEIVSARAWAMVQSAQNSAQAGCFNRSSGRELKAGDIALIELATCVNGYWSDLTRTVTVGPPTDETASLLNAVSEAKRVAITSIHPGVPAKDVDASARESLRLAGFAGYFTHATGHHTGFRYHDPGFAISPNSEGILEPGMVITIEPGAYMPERGIGARFEDNVLVTDDGADVLNTERQTLN